VLSLLLRRIVFKALLASAARRVADGGESARLARQQWGWPHSSAVQLRSLWRLKESYI